MKVHKRIIKEGKNHYLCNQAYNMSGSRIVDKLEFVTCKNCLKILQNKSRRQ
jgi:hypothetical protein